MRQIINRIKDRSERISLFARFSLLMNMVFVVGKIIIGIFTASVFMYINALYSVGIGLTKFLFLRNYRITERIEEQRACYIRIGCILLVASCVYVLYSFRMILGASSMKYPQNVAIAIAAVTFAEIGLNIRGSIVAHRNDTPLVQALKLTNLASSLIALVLTQTALLSFTSTADNSVPNGMIGILMGACSAGVGLFMVLHMRKIMSGKKTSKEFP